VNGSMSQLQEREINKQNYKGKNNINKHKMYKGIALKKKMYKGILKNRKATQYLHFVVVVSISKGSSSNEDNIIYVPLHRPHYKNISKFT